MIMTRTHSVNVAPTVAAHRGDRSPVGDQAEQALSARSRTTCTPAAMLPNPGLRKGSQYRDQGCASRRDHRAEVSRSGSRRPPGRTARLLVLLQHPRPLRRQRQHLGQVVGRRQVGTAEAARHHLPPPRVRGQHRFDACLLRSGVRCCVLARRRSANRA